MALLPNNAPTTLTEQDIAKWFGIAQDGQATEAQLAYQRDIREAYAALAGTINRDVADGREKSQALTLLEDSLMWTGKAIFK